MHVIESAQGSHITIDGKEYVLFASNSYLDLCNNEYVKEKTETALHTYGTGSGGSRLTTGTTALHSELEGRLASFKKREDAIVFNTGYMANVGVIGSLTAKGDVIFSDELNHASIIDGCRLSKAEVVKYRHNDMEDLEEKLKLHKGKNGLIVSDGVFSMDGDIVNLPKLVRLANEYGMLSMIDEAHATGVLGANGYGTEEYYGMEGVTDIVMGTLSKAVGSEGGFVCADGTIVNYLRNKARSFIFSTALSPVTIASAIAGLECITADRVAALRNNVQYFCDRLHAEGFDVQSDSAIIPVIVGDEQKALAISAKLMEHGYYISAIRYPTVKKNSARLRITLMSSHTKEEMDGLAGLIGRYCK
ncbi:MAG: 8-amino-7-oxononanoate synthase [Lachnospiraceae bacterium]|nr:8-amino-7-oxononanoate synthase [Lachnospiraceae bacterium]